MKNIKTHYIQYNIKHKSKSYTNIQIKKKNYRT